MSVTNILSATMLLGLVSLFGQVPLANAENGHAQCKALESTDFYAVKEAPARILSAQIVEAAAGLPAYCQVKGYVIPSVGFDLWLPTENWNGKLLESGNGGDGGRFASEWLRACDAPLLKGYACITTDTGHKGSGGSWAVNNLQALVDFGYRSSHVTAVAGKAIVERYYSKKPTRAYFEGCSTGGEEALVEAERFPWDFDGIIADGAWINDSDSTMHMVWSNRALTGKDGKALLTRTDVELLHNAALAECDLDDGVKDGIISDPPACKFDPSKLLCKADQRAACLTQPQVDAARKVYGGPVNSQGRKIYPGGAAIGSELSWVDAPLDFVHTGNDRQSAAEGWALLFFRHMVMPPGGPAWQMADYDFDRDYKRFANGTQESLLNSGNPDLRKFKAAGGKLIIVHGWLEAVSSPPANVIDYYETMARTVGGRANTEDFARLFIVPGRDHCGGADGPGADVVDVVNYLEQWVERGQPPDRMIAAHLNSKGGIGLFTRFPLPPEAVVFTRPVYPYPLHAKYLGKGDPNEAANFGPAGSAPQ